MTGTLGVGLEALNIPDYTSPEQLFVLPPFLINNNHLPLTFLPNIHGSFNQSGVVDNTGQKEPLTPLKMKVLDTWHETRALVSVSGRAVSQSVSQSVSLPVGRAVRQRSGLSWSDHTSEGIWGLSQPWQNQNGSGWGQQAASVFPCATRALPLRRRLLFGGSFDSYYIEVCNSMRQFISVESELLLIESLYGQMMK